MEIRKLCVLALLMLALVMMGCSKDDDNNTPVITSPATSTFAPDLAKEWMDLSYRAVKGSAVSPPVASRIYGYASVALYEALVPGMPDHISLAGQLDALASVPRPAANTLYDWPTVANHATSLTLETLFASAPDSIRQLIPSLRDSWSATRQAAVSAEVYDRSVTLGTQIATAILDWAATDGFAQYNNCAYTPPTGPGYWVPTPPAFAAPLQPCWGQMRTFLLERNGGSLACDPSGPPAYSTDTSSTYYHEAMTVYSTSQTLTDEERAIANFWADGATATGTPPGHWIMIAGQLLVQQQMDLADAAEVYARAGIAVHDAFISCWKAKFQMCGMRPITFIQAQIAANWTPLLTTPNFPTCTSGHSTSSGAAATALEAFFGTVAFTDHTHDARGLPSRSFESLSQAADEAAVSRLYAGIHYASDNNIGLVEGRCIGNLINTQLQFRAPAF
jgi:hypothetical protein